MPRRRLIEHFAVVGLQDSVDDEKNSHTPQILYKFPKGPEDSLLGLTTCCYPDISQVVAINHLKKGNYLLSERYTFVLTRSNADRLFGFCFRFVAPDTDGSLRKYPICLCLMSSFPFFGFFYDVLSYLSTRWIVQPDAVIPTVRAVGAVHIDDALLLDTFEVRIPCTESQDSDEVLKFHVRPTSYDISFKTLFKSLCVDNVLFVLSCILLELRVITLSKSLQRLSDCTHALHSLLYPFVWQHIFIPLLPESLASYLSSPIPFLIGVPAYIFKNCRKKDLSSVVVVNLDSDQVSTRGLSELTQLPEKLSSRLRDQLYRTLKERLGDERWKKNPKAKAAFHESSKKLTGAKESQILTWDDQEISDAFLAFFIVLANDYKHYIPELESDVERAEQYEEDIADFLKKLAHSQLFNQWLEKQKAIDKDPFKMHKDRYSCILSYISGQSYSEAFKFLQTNYQTKRASTDVVLKLKGLRTAAMEYTSNTAKASNLPLLVQAICLGANESRTINTVFDVLEFRISDSEKKMHMHGIRALNLLEYLLENGIDLVVAMTHYRLHDVIKKLFIYEHKNEKIRTKMRKLAKRIFEMLQKVTELKKYRSNRYVRLERIERYRCPEEVISRDKESLYERLLKVDFSQPRTAECAFVDVLGLAGHGQASFSQPSVMEQVQISSKFNPLRSARYRQKALEGNVPDIPPFQHLHKVFKPGAKLKRKQKSANFGEAELSLVSGFVEKKNDPKNKTADVLDIFPFLGASSAQVRSDTKGFVRPRVQATDSVGVLSHKILDSRKSALVPPAASNPASSAFLSSYSPHKPSEPDEWDDFDAAFKKTNIGSGATDFFRTPIASERLIPKRSVLASSPIGPVMSYSEQKRQDAPFSGFFSALNVPLQPVPNIKKFQPAVVNRSRVLPYSSSNPNQSDFFTQLTKDGIWKPAAPAQNIKLPVKLRRPNDPFAGLN